MVNKPIGRAIALLIALCSIALIRQSALALGDDGGSSLSPLDMGLSSPYGATLSPGSPSNAMIRIQQGIIAGQLGIAQGALARDQSMVGMGGYAGNPSYAGFVGALQGQANFLSTVLATRAAIGPNGYGTFGAGKLISNAFGGGIPSEDVMGFFAPSNGYLASSGMRSLMRATTAAAMLSTNLSVGFMFPGGGLGELGGGGGSFRMMQMPNINYGLAGSNILGRTAMNGAVTLRPGLSWAEQALTLRHEGVHAFFSVGDDAMFAAARQRFGMWGYNNSQLLRFTEEALAEGYASRSIMQGLAHPIVNPYGITLPGLAGEASLVGAGGFGIYYGLDSIFGQ